MRRVHVLRVEEAADAFAPLLAAAAAAGVRVGWLDLATQPAPPPELAAALAAGGERAVAAGAELTVVARTRRGAPRLRDLVRTHFAGCAAVLVRGRVEAPSEAGRRSRPGKPAPPTEWPRVAPRGDGTWSVRTGDRERRLGTAELVAALREARPFAPAEPLS